MNVMMYGRSMGVYKISGSRDHALPGFHLSREELMHISGCPGQSFVCASAQRLALIPIHGLHFVVSISQYFYKYK